MFLRGGFGLIEFVHQARFAARGIVLFDDPFFGGFIQRAYRHADGLFRLHQVACGDQRVRVLDFRSCRHSHHAIARAAAKTLPHRFQPRVFLRFLNQSCQCENPPRMISWRTILQLGVFDKSNHRALFVTYPLSRYNSRVNSKVLAPPRRLARAATTVMLFFVASRALGLLRDVVISHQFGTARALDAYFAAFTIPDFVFNVLAGGALGSAFIPIFSAALAQNDARRAWRLASSIIGLVFGVLTALCIGLAMGAPTVVALTVARGFASAEQALTADLMRWMLVTPIVFGVSGIVMGILNSYQHFALPALAPVVYNAAIIAGALVLAPTWGVYGLVAGVVAGAVLHLAVQIPLAIHFGSQIPDLGFGVFTLRSALCALRSPDVREVVRLMLPRTLGIAAVQMNFVVNTILASALPVGAIAALAYAWRIMLLPVGIVGQSLATAVFPTFSAQAARADWDDLRATFSAAFRATLFLTIPAAVGLIVLGAPFVTLLFQRGEFDAASTRQTTWALQFFALALFAHSGLEIVARAFYALHDTLTPVAVGIGAMGLNIALSLALSAPLQHGGLALANSLATILEMTTLLVILRRRIASVDEARLARSAARIVAATLAMTLVLVPFAQHFAASPIFVALGGILIGTSVYVIVAFVLRAEELAFVWRRVRIVNRKSEILN